MLRSKDGFTLLELMIVIGIIATIAAIAIPGLVSAQRAANERNASASLKSVVTANHDFRSNDRDGNRIVDFWTGDVAGLSLIVPQNGTAAPASLTYGAAIRLLDLSMAGADAAFGGGVRYASTMHVPVANAIVAFSPKASYWYARLVNEVSSAGSIAYQNDTDGATNALWGACHSNDRFGFVAFPGSFGSGRLAFIVSHEGVIFKTNLSANYVATVAVTPTTTASTIAGTNLAPGLTTFEYPQPPAGGWSRMD